jgi:hypothetical protein
MMMAINDKPQSGLVTIYTATGMLQAVVLQNILERTGIPVRLEYETFRYLPGALSALCGDIRLLVPSPYEKEALSLINARNPGGEIFGLLNHS